MTQVAWFEIPVKDVARATEFYGAVLGESLGEMDGPDGPMTVFLGEDGPIGAFTTEDTTVAEAGVLVYFEVADIPASLARVAAAGGEVMQEKTSIGPFGWIGRLRDSEGNAVALHTSAPE